MKNQKGVAAVEFAIILPVLLLLVFGIIEFSLILYDKAVITNASREGARAGIVFRSPSLTDAQIASIVNAYGANLIPAATLVPEITPAVRKSGDELTVRVPYTYTFMVLPKFMTFSGGKLDLSAVTVMRME
jgi:Flp pilus assembly protein TadG